MKLHQAFASICDLSPSAIADLEAIFICQSGEKGISLLSIAQQNKVIWIETGLLRAYAYYDGYDTTTWFVASQELLYTNPAETGHELSYSHVEFLEKTIYWTCDWDALQHLYTKHPDLNTAGQTWVEWLLRRYSNMLYLLRVLTPIERLEYFEQHHPKVYLSAPLKYVASFLGIAPETLSRLRRKRLERAKARKS